MLVVRMNNTYIRQRPVPLREIKTVANDPLVTDRKSQVVDFDIDLGLVLFVKEGAGSDRCRAAGLEHVDQIVQRVAGIDDILDDHNVSSRDTCAYVHDQADGAAWHASMVVA